jgi:hypothetical protein
MLIESSTQFLTTPVSKTPKRQLIFWFSFSLTIAALYGVLFLRQAFSSPYAIQDDARQHVFWMQRFLDPQRFPNDLIADYFQSVAPWGYTCFYRLLAAIGLTPPLASKLLPFFLGLTTTAYSFGVALQLLPIPLTGFIATVLTNQLIWSHDDIASASPRAFMPMLFLAFLYYLMKRLLLPCLAAIALEGLFYPQYVFVFAGILFLQPLQWQQGKLRLSQDKRDYILWGTGLVLACLVMLPYVLKNSTYGPVITAAAAKLLPEFAENGRSAFFSDNFSFFWIKGNRSGLFPTFKPIFLAIGLLLPLLLRFPRHFPATRQLTNQNWLLLKIIAVGLTLYSAAHALLFRLHLPSRYSGYTLRFVFVFAAALSLVILLDAGLQHLRHSTQLQWIRQLLILGSILGMSLTLLLYPVYTKRFPDTNYYQGDEPKLYAFFAQQPADSLIASLTKEVDYLPTFAGRSILVGKEYAIPYHLGYSNQFRQRVKALIQAQYTLEPQQLTTFIQTYGVDFWLLERNSFQPSWLETSWVKQYPDAIALAQRSLQQGKPLLATLRRRCTVFSENQYMVLPSSCVLQALNDRATSPPQKNNQR